MSDSKQLFKTVNKTVKPLIKKPENHFLNADQKLSAKLATVTKALYDFAKSTADPNGSFSGGPLEELYVEGFDAEQIWQQLDMQNQPMLESLELGLQNLLGGEDEDEDLNEDLNEDEDEGDDEESGEDFETLLEQQREAQDDDDEEEEEQGEGDAESEDEDADADGEMADEGDRAQEEEDEDNDEDEDMQPVDGDAPAGDFFDMEEYEKFADEDIDPVDLEQDEGDEGDEGDFDPVNMSYADFFGSKAPKKMKAKADQDDADSEEEEKEIEAFEKPAALSAFEKQERAMMEKVRSLEEQILQPRSWDLAGEVEARKRPAESLLETDVDFEYGSRPAADITEETTKDLEDIIKQRIIDEAWDDVERKVALKEKVFKPVEEISAEKSTLGLAEVYEQEYLKLATGDEKTVAQEKLNEKHQEIAVLFAKLSIKLDALSDFHFTPKPPTEEVTVVSSAPAISMEEIIPLGVSAHALEAPQEGYKSKAKGMPVSKEEMDVAEKKSNRSKRKRIRKRQDKEKAIAMGAKGKDARQLGELTTGRHMRKGTKSKDSNKSSAVFAKLQEMAGGKLPTKEDETPAGRGKSKALKL